MRGALRIAGGEVERDQRAHAVAGHECALYAGGVEQGGQPVGHGCHGGERRAGAAAVAGQIDRQYAEAMVREVTCLQCPHAMVVLRAVDEDRGRQAGVEWFAAGVRIGGLALNGENHADSGRGLAALAGAADGSP